MEYPEYGGVRYSDETALPGDSLYYKARNYMDTDNGRVYGKYSKCTTPFYASYRGGKYKMWLDEDLTAKEKNQIVVGFYSYSLANPALHFDYASCRLGKDDLPLEIKEYSFDGIHWKKKWTDYKKFSLPAKKTVYLKMELEDKKKAFALEKVESVDLNTFLVGSTSEYIDFYCDTVNDVMSYVISSDD